DVQSIEAARTIKRNGQHLLAMINDILDLSKMEAGKLQLQRESVAPFEMVQDIASSMKVTAEAKGLPLAVEFVGPIPVTIESDTIRLRQILINMLGNAIKFTQTGSIRLVVHMTKDDEEQPKLRFDVIDTGVGMTEDQLATVFEPFVQCDGSATRKFGGTGLGLAVCARLAEALGGTVSAKSTYHQGSTFTLTIDPGLLEGIPMIDGSTGCVIETNDQPSDAAPIEAPRALRVLVVEDGPDNQRLISYILKKAGMEPIVVANGQEALEAVWAAVSRERGTAPPFDVILMDMQMPVLDGYEATIRLRADGYTGPIIALTAHAMTHDREKCLDAGCDEYLTKPIDRQLLLDTIERYADGQTPHSTANADVVVSPGVYHA
ncbi:MAG: response regulator, partial [Pirellulales bacterium]|nr:response regulator [Pirellulales bacterium]